MEGKYVSQKISRVRWRPASGSSLQLPECFATGSWDAEQNKVCLWKTVDMEGTETDQLFMEDTKPLCEINHNGDVMDLQFLDQERIVTASSTGSVIVFRHHVNNQALSVLQHWDHAHYHSHDSAPCTSLVCNGPEIITVGEDGRINHFQADQKEPVRTIDNADSSSLNAVTFLRTTEILTVNSIGQLKIWDFRQPGNKPRQIYSLTGDRVPLHCVDRHPNQQHIVATGGQDGTFCIWDVRQGSIPISLLDAHSAEMWEVHFHPSNPDHVFTCSEDGSLWHWNASVMAPDLPSFLQHGRRNFSLNGTVPHANSNQSLSSAWLTMDAAKGRVDIDNLLSAYTLSVNSLDVVGEYLVCGTDAEAVYITHNLEL
ncbi:nucleoporin Nup43 [Carcharodon carcharias]|uniref:nucleoporin Nup43 n=1 Tax=Carcharodon carcharias TaxID=13397 RepID=UPI001B7E3DD3|nr:nucleoporin Nup43 [Carcharodon carcharias]